MKSRERKIMGWAISSLITVVVLSFSLFQAKNIITGPQIEIENPLDGQTVEESLTHIEGSTKNITEIKLNGRNIFVNEEGEFEETMLLAYGYNKIVIEAEDRFGRKKMEELEIVLK
jgi:hypothetical protein